MVEVFDSKILVSEPFRGAAGVRLFGVGGIEFAFIASLNLALRSASRSTEDIVLSYSITEAAEDFSTI